MRGCNLDLVRHYVIIRSNLTEKTFNSKSNHYYLHLHQYLPNHPGCNPLASRASRAACGSANCYVRYHIHSNSLRLGEFASLSVAGPCAKQEASMNTELRVVINNRGGYVVAMSSWSDTSPLLGFSALSLPQGSRVMWKAVAGKALRQLPPPLPCVLLEFILNLAAHLRRRITTMSYDIQCGIGDA